jgi:hypothetical protein
VILVVDFDRRGVFLSDRNEAHSVTPLALFDR